nr:hypothetical protein CFP56_31352 [Quercus suber]
MVVASLKLLSEMESASVPSNEHASTTGSNANSSSVRAKCDPAWDHVTEELKDEKSSYRCIHCWKTYKGGGIYRMKRHLAGIKGDVAACMGVPYDVRFQMVENLKDISKSKEQTKKDQEASNYSPLKDSLEFEDVQEITSRDMDDDVIEDDDDINLESFGNEDDAPPEFRDKNHPIHVEDEEACPSITTNENSWMRLDRKRQPMVV